MIDAKTTHWEAITAHCHAARGDADQVLAYIPEDVLADRNQMLELRDVIVLHLDRTRPGFCETLGL